MSLLKFTTSEKPSLATLSKTTSPITPPLGLPWSSDGKESACSARDWGSILGLGRSPGEANGYPLQYSGQENSMDRGAWQATVHKVAESDMTERLSLQRALLRGARKTLVLDNL